MNNMYNIFDSSGINNDIPSLIKMSSQLYNNKLVYKILYIKRLFNPDLIKKYETF